MNMLKLSVGTESVESLVDWQARRCMQLADGQLRHVTRMWPKRAEEILSGGSIYWVICGLIQARQRITGFREVIGEDGIRRCGIELDPSVIRTQIVPRRPFQGWRYLTAEDAPADLGSAQGRDSDVPPELMAALADIGVR